MKQFETKLTVRIYDTKIIEDLNTIFKLNRNRYQTKNQLIVELLERGIKDKIKELATAPNSQASVRKNSSDSKDEDEMLKQLKDMLSDLHTFNKQHVEGLLAHLKMSERMSACIYNILLAVATDEPITKLQVEIGYMDDVPKRFKDFLNKLLASLSNEESDDSDSEDLTGVAS